MDDPDSNAGDAGKAPEATAQDPSLRRSFLILFFSYLAIVTVVAVPSMRAWMQPRLIVLRYEFNWFLGWLPMPDAAARYAQQKWGGLIHIVLFSLLGLLFYKLAQRLWKHPETFTMKEIAWLSALVTIFYFPILPYISCDVFLYIVKGWMDSALDIDPYIHGFGEISNINRHPMGANAHPGYRFILGNYGPLFQQWSRLLTSISGDDIQAALALVKVGNALALLATGWLAAKLAETVSVSGRFVFFALVCNPLSQFCFVSAAHNDIVMMVPLLGAFLAAQTRKYVIAGGLLGVAFAIKFVPLIFLPVLVIFIFARERGAKRWGLTAILLLAFVVTSALSFASTPGAIDVFGATVGIGYGYARSSIYVIPGFLFGWDGAWFRFAAGGALIVLLILLWVLVLTRRVVYEPASLFAWGAATVAFYLFLLSQMVGEWYFIWILPFTLMSKSDRVRNASLLISVCLMPLAIFTCDGSLAFGLSSQVLTWLIYSPLLIFAFLSGIPVLQKPQGGAQAHGA